MIESARILHAGWSRFVLATVALADGTRYDREVEHHGDAAAILPYDPARRVAILVSQLRVATLYVGSSAHVLEVPAGLLDEDDPAACARREAEEEAGLALRELEPAGSCWALPGISTERLHLYLAPYGASDRTSAGGGLAAENEHIAVHELPLRELAAMADDGRLVDMKTLLLVQTLRLRRPELFAA